MLSKANHYSVVFHSQFISIAFIHTPHLLHISPYIFFVYIYIARGEYLLIPDNAVDRRKLEFYNLDFNFFKQQFKASLEQFYIF